MSFDRGLRVSIDLGSIQCSFDFKRFSKTKTLKTIWGEYENGLDQVEDENDGEEQEDSEEENKINTMDLHVHFNVYEIHTEKTK